MADDTSISAFFSGWELFQYAALSSTALGAVLGAMGVYIVVRRMVFFSAALSQVAALGVAMSFWLGAPALLFATLFTGAAVTPAAMRPSRRGVRSDSMLGLIFLFGAAGTLAVGTKIVQDLHEIDTLLLGSAVAVLPRDAYWVAAVSLLLALLHGWWWRAFVGVSMDSAGARVRAMPVSLLDLTLFASLAVGVALSTTVIGALPTFAFSVIARHRGDTCCVQPGSRTAVGRFFRRVDRLRGLSARIHGATACRRVSSAARDRDRMPRGARAARSLISPPMGAEAASWQLSPEPRYGIRALVGFRVGDRVRPGCRGCRSDAAAAWGAWP